MKNKLFLLFFAAILVTLVYFGYPIIKSRYFASSPKVIAPEKLEEKTNNEISSEKNEESSQENPEETIDVSKIIVSPSDCDNECSRFQKDTEQEYCEQICGISDLYEYGAEKEEEADEESADCKKKTGLKKDYCLKDKAIEEEDMRICEKISDSAISKTCKNRIMEDILENQN